MMLIFILVKEIKEGSVWEEIALYEYSYDLKVLNVQDSIATAKILHFTFPFVTPLIGDKVQIK